MASKIPRSSFTSPQSDTNWKKEAERLQRELVECKDEFEEFQASSKELETELETQLEQLECKNKDLQNSNHNLLKENETLREKLDELQSSYHTQLSEVQDELAELIAYKDELQKYIRQLEQTNDDLERSKRAVVVSLEDFESRLNAAIERNAFLESEIEDKETMTESIQRLKDEARDLRQEIHVKKKRDYPLNSTSDQESLIAQTNRSIDSNKLAESGYTSNVQSPSSSSTTTPTSPKVLGRQIQRRPPSSLSSGGGVVPSRSSKVFALNILGELVRKVGDLETKLASCRNFVKDRPAVHPSGSSSRPVHPASGQPSRELPPRLRRVNRAAPGAVSTPQAKIPV